MRGSHCIICQLAVSSHRSTKAISMLKSYKILVMRVRHEDHQWNKNCERSTNALFSTAVLAPPHKYFKFLTVHGPWVKRLWWVCTWQMFFNFKPFPGSSHSAGKADHHQHCHFGDFSVESLDGDFFFFFTLVQRRWGTAQKHRGHNYNLAAAVFNWEDVCWPSENH